jgi:hypothetical protein
MRKFSTFHVDHNSNPDITQTFLELVSIYPGTDNETLLRYGREQDLWKKNNLKSAQNLRQRAASYLEHFGFLEPRKNTLTQNGHTLHHLRCTRPDLFGDVMHYFFYTTWNATTPTRYCFSWSYATAVRLLWAQIQGPLDTRTLVNEVVTLAETTFPEVKGSVAFSSDSIRGVTNWLRPLKPEVITEQKNTKSFARRSFCPPELFVFAVDYAYRIHNTPYQSNLLVTPDVQNSICQLCILEPDSFERLTSYAVLQFPFLKQGMGGGWGSYLLLERAPRLEDLL